MASVGVQTYTGAYAADMGAGADAIVTHMSANAYSADMDAHTYVCVGSTGSKQSECEYGDQ
jgi:hypothetical protein